MKSRSISAADLGKLSYEHASVVHWRISLSDNEISDIRVEWRWKRQSFGALMYWLAALERDSLWWLRAFSGSIVRDPEIGRGLSDAAKRIPPLLEGETVGDYAARFGLNLRDAALFWDIARLRPCLDIGRCNRG